MKSDIRGFVTAGRDFRVAWNKTADDMLEPSHHKFNEFLTQDTSSFVHYAYLGYFMHYAYLRYEV